MRVYISDLTVSMINDINKKTEENGYIFKPHVLFPYAHRESEKNNKELFNIVENAELCSSVMVDSGTYVMHKLTTKKKVNFDFERGFNDYTNFISNVSKFCGKIDYYVNFDVSFDVSDAYEINSCFQNKMEQMNLSPIYVIHSLDSKEYNFVIEKKYNIVALSSAVLSESGDYKKADELVKKLYNAGVRVHLLGCASFNKLSKSCAWSCDASSYARWAGLGKAIFFSKKHRSEITLSLSEINSDGEINESFFGLEKNQCLRHEYDDFIYDGLGITIDDIAGDKSGQLLQQANAYHMYKLEEYVTTIQKASGITFSEW